MNMTQSGDEKLESAREAHLFGTFKGVFLPSILTIFGVIMYLRMGWVVGNAGIVGTIIIVTVSSAITLITALSMSSIATNMKVGGGGAYYMVSRSLGVEAGAAIGLSLYFAKAIGTAFYIVGFAESVHTTFPMIPEIAVDIISLFLVTFLAYVSANLALKASMVIFVIIVLSIASFFMGSPYEGGAAQASVIAGQPASFWIVFAVFFPAVTGIEAGMSMSGDLKNPARALPLGSIIAVFLGYAVYIAVPIFLYYMAPKEALIGNLMIFKDVSRFKILVLLGVWGATLSSALGSLLGAPRNLQAIARDRIVPTFLGRGHGPADTPRIATAVTFAIAIVAVLIGNLNSIAPVLSMFFLTTYGSLNLIAGIEGMINNPSWRPAFRTPWIISLIGAALCLGAMFMINAGATFIAIFAIALLYYMTAKRKFNARWLDIRRSIHMALARFSIYRLIGTEEHAKSWRPNVLVLSGSPQRRLYLIELADAITHGKGFLTVASILAGEDIPMDKIYSMEKSIHKYLEERNIPALVEVVAAKNRMEGIENLVRTYGIGPLVPNTVLVGEAEDEENIEDFTRMIMLIYRSKRNLVIVRENHIKEPHAAEKKRISCWWGGKRHNAGLMLALSYMLQTSDEWRDSSLTIKTIAKDDDDSEKIHHDINGFLKEARLIAEPEVTIHPYDHSPLPTAIREASRDVDLVFIGMRPPDEDETVESYTAYYRILMERTEDFPMLAIVLAAEEIKFQDIFV
jgi:amino acid transporter